MANRLNLVLSVVVGGLAIHGIIAACGNVASKPDAQSADAAEPGGMAVPAGTIVAFGGTSIPAGWVLCDGSAVSRSAYAALFSAIGIQHGLGDGIMTFNLPDLRGMFLRGTDHGRGVDPDAADRTAAASGARGIGDSVGSVEIDQLGSHQHAGTTDGESLPANTSGMWYDNPDQNRFSYTPGGAGIAQNLRHTHNFTTDMRGGKETRPRNVSVDYIIKL